jgi:hypothetical protein
MSFRAHIIDATALREITPMGLRAYAEAQGWRRVEDFGEHSTVYGLANAPEAIIPATAAIADYAQVISDIIALFARVEDRDELQIYRDLLTADQDVIRVSAPAADDDGSVQLEAGVQLVSRAYDLLLSAACSASEPRPTYRAGSVREAAEYMNRVRLGQSERGSFTLTLLSPVPPALDPPQQGSFWPEMSEEPFERRVTRRLMQGLRAAREAIEKANRGQGFSAFENAVTQGISANLCEAAANLIQRGAGLEVSVTWAYTRSTPVKRQEQRFLPQDGEVLREAASQFRAREPQSDETLEGYIIKLSRPEDEPSGWATLRTLFANRQVSVRIDLEKDLYEKAVEANKNQSAVSLKGDLVREGRRWLLKYPREFFFLQTEEDKDDSTPAAST